MKFSDALKEFYNLISPYLTDSQKIFIPVTYSFISSAVKTGEKELFSEKINIPRITKNCPLKPNNFIIFFFKDDNILKKQYSKEIKSENMKILRKEFKILYPLLILKDPFLNLVFKEEIKNRQFYKISGEYKKRRKELTETIKRIKESPVFDNVKRWLKIAVETFFKEFLNNKNFRELIFEKLNKDSPY